VAIDMWRPYRDVSHQMFPGRPVVIDKFHVVRMANYCMERVRIRLQKQRKAGERRLWLQSKAMLNMRYAKLAEKGRFNLDMWLANEPELAAAYGLKEAFYNIYDLPKAQAVAAFDAFPGTIPASLKADFKTLTTAMKNWRTEILAYFDHPITNAYTEALNGVAKTINRQGRGYTFEVLRARLLYGKGPLEPWRLATVYPANPTQLQLLKREQGNRCQSCGCELGRTKDDKANVVVLVRGNTRRQPDPLCHADVDAASAVAGRHPTAAPRYPVTGNHQLSDAPHGPEIIGATSRIDGRAGSVEISSGTDGDHRCRGGDPRARGDDRRGPAAPMVERRGCATRARRRRSHLIDPEPGAKR